jgi:hypothetical protein
LMKIRGLVAIRVSPPERVGKVPPPVDVRAQTRANRTRFGVAANHSAWRTTGR